MFAASAAFLPTQLSVETVLSVFSAGMTAWFWLVKARRERPHLEFHQLSNFRASLRRGDAETKSQRLCLSQIGAGGVLAANHSVRQNSIIRFDCFLKDGANWIKGRWGYTDEDKPPWNVGPESTIAISPACFFDVPEGYSVPDDVEFHLEFLTVGGKRFGHTFRLQVPEDL